MSPGEDNHASSRDDDELFQPAGTAVSSPPTTSKQNPNMNLTHLLDSQLPLVGKATDMQPLDHAVEKITVQKIENPLSGVVRRDTRRGKVDLLAAGDKQVDRFGKF